MGVKSVEKDGKKFVINGFSGSKYIVHEDNYGYTTVIQWSYEFPYGNNIPEYQKIIFRRFFGRMVKLGPW